MTLRRAVPAVGGLVALVIAVVALAVGGGDGDGERSLTAERGRTATETSTTTAAPTTDEERGTDAPGPDPGVGPVTPGPPSGEPGAAAAPNGSGGAGSPPPATDPAAPAPPSPPPERPSPGGTSGPPAGPSAAPDDFGKPASVSKVAHALNPDTAIYDRPGGALVRRLANPNENGAPLVFLVVAEQPGWWHVHLPVRPNGSTGWVRADHVSVVQHDYRIDVSVGRHQIVVMKGADTLVREPVAIGTADTPTPGGTFYVKELLQPPNPGGAYGPYAYGLSGFSNVLTEFNGGRGVIGIHGTNQPELIGTDVSHGCIRMSNAGITHLAGILPLGVPVRIMA